MQVSKRQISQMLEKQINKMWYQLVADIKSVEDAELILGDMFSRTEMAVIAKRLAIGYWLIRKRGYENIKDNLKVSSATIASVHHDLGRRGWKLAMEKISADEWATRWESKIKKWNLFRG